MRRTEADRRARRLVRWYPKEWRARYGEEFTQLLIDDIDERPRSWRRTFDVARGGLAAQIAHRPLARSRTAIIGLTLGVALAAAAVLHAVFDPHREIRCPPHPGNPGTGCLIIPGHGWSNPAAIGIALLGVAAASGVLWAAILRPLQRRIAGALAIVGVGAALVVWVTTYEAVVQADGYDPTAGSVAVHRPPTWTAADAALIGIAALALAFAVFLRIKPLTRLRLAGVVLVLGLSFAGAAFPHLARDPSHFRECLIRAPAAGDCLHQLGSGWMDPAALALCALGAVGAAALLLTTRRRA